MTRGETSGGPGRRALILSGSIGQGHATVAEVCRQALEKTAPKSPSVPVLDCIELLGPLSSFVAHRLFRAAVSLPGLYDGFHFTELRGEGRLGRGGDGASTRRITRALERKGLADGVGLALAVFATGAPVVGPLARRSPGGRAVVFLTDATAHGRWVGEGVDLYLVTCDLAARSLRRYEPQAEIAIVPPPVRAEFFSAESQDRARHRLGVPLVSSCVLLVGGGWGLGPLEEAAKALAADGHHVLAVSGTNRRLSRRLDRLASSDDRVRSLGFCHDMATAISAADVVVSATGQTCNEVHAVGRHLVVLDTVPGHGRENLLHEVMNRAAIAASPRASAVRRSVAAALKNGDRPALWPVSSPEECDALFLRALEPLQVL